MKNIITNVLSGDKKALSDLLDLVNEKVFSLCVYYLGEIPLAEDACQDILLKIADKLNTLKEADKFENWALVVASNHLRNMVTRSHRYEHISFEAMGEESVAHLSSEYSDNRYESEIELAYELKVSCTIAMIMCLNEDDRMVFLYGELLNLKSSDIGEIMGVSADTARKRLSRSKQKLLQFIHNNCGLINKDNPCKCRSRLFYAMDKKRVAKDRIEFSHSLWLSSKEQIEDKIAEMEHLEDLSAVYANNPHYELPEYLFKKVLQITQNNFS